MLSISNQILRILPDYQDVIFYPYCSSKGYTLALINVGAPAGGMNSAGRAAVRLAQYEGHTVLGIKDGFDGLMTDKVNH